MKCYAHNRVDILAKSEKKPALLKYRGGDMQVLLPTGQQLRLTPKDRSESGKARRKRIKFARCYTRELAAANQANSSA